MLSKIPAAPREKDGWPWVDSENTLREQPANDLRWPKVTIVTPSFNQGQYLEETIRSVLMQDYPNLEYIIIDGGSSDESVAIIKKYEACLAYWISEPDKGQADAINKGFSIATGEMLGWLNSDDLLYPGAIREVVELFQLDSCLEMVYGDVDYGFSRDSVVRKITGTQMSFSEMLRTLQVPIPQQGSLWRRSVFDKVGMLDARWQVVLDREFFVRVAEMCKFVYLPKTLGFFRDHELSKSSSQQVRWLNELPAMYKELFSREKLNEKIFPFKAETMGVVFITCASIALRDGQKIAAGEFFLKAVSHDPLIFFRKFIRNKLLDLIRLRLMVF